MFDYQTHRLRAEELRREAERERLASRVAAARRRRRREERAAGRNGEPVNGGRGNGGRGNGGGTDGGPDRWVRAA
ncbi:hypothetical protein [Streptomyces sp. DH37]|uniref:hypothetical protein n=1 Tax=Streptomyces sp. DH37 TaxID=3040122 RepID=UPI0024427CCE|nr:hypothetical protein [Streptomyces sp. DH37]MDG9704785.1 hypothetical protein [Streptomyces sp. DH37]